VAVSVITDPATAAVTGDEDALLNALANADAIVPEELDVRMRPFL